MLCAFLSLTFVALFLTLLLLVFFYEDCYHYFLFHYIPSAYHHVWHIVGAQQILILAKSLNLSYCCAHGRSGQNLLPRVQLGCILGDDFHLSYNYFGVLVCPYIFSGFLSLGTMSQRWPASSYLQDGDSKKVPVKLLTSWVTLAGEQRY